MLGEFVPFRLVAFLPLNRSPLLAERADFRKSYGSSESLFKDARLCLSRRVERLDRTCNDLRSSGSPKQRNCPTEVHGRVAHNSRWIMRCASILQRGFSSFQIRVRLLWAEKPKRGIRCCSMGARILCQPGVSSRTAGAFNTSPSAFPATPSESSVCYCGAAAGCATSSLRHSNAVSSSSAATSRAFSTSGLVHWMGARIKLQVRDGWQLSDSYGLLRKTLKKRYHKCRVGELTGKPANSGSVASILPVDQASSTVFPAKPLFTRASGFSGQRVASRCGYIPLRPGPKIQEFLKNGGYKYVSKGLQGRLKDWKRERGVSE